MACGKHMRYLQDVILVMFYPCAYGDWWFYPSLFYIQLCNAHFDDMARFCVVEILNGAVKSVLERGNSSLSMARNFRLVSPHARCFYKLSGSRRYLLGLLQYLLKVKSFRRGLMCWCSF